jgi:predicted branched-subunit amino acid permease
VTASAVGVPAVAPSDFRRGVRSMTPIVVSYLPFGLAVGTVVAAGPDLVARWAATILVYGGSAQLVLLRGLDAGAPIAAAVGALAVNLRLVAYSASLAPAWRDQPRWFRVVGAAAVIDPTWALAARDLDAGADRDAHRGFVMGAALVLTVGFVSEVTVGAALADRLGLPGGVGLLALALPVNLAVVVAPRLRERVGAAALLAGAAAGWFAADLPPGVGLVLAVVLGGALGATLRPAGAARPS